MDGSAVNSDYEENIIHDTDKITMYLDKVVNPDDIESITFAGVTVPVTKNPKPVQYVHYNYPDMGFSIDLQKELDDITKNKVTEYYDKFVKAKAKKISYTGTIDKTSLDMFDIIMFKTDLSKNELEKRNDMLQYLGYSNGYVYAITYGEPVTEAQMNKFIKVENRDVVNIMPRISIYGVGNSGN